MDDPYRVKIRCSDGKPLCEEKTETYLTGEMVPCYATDNDLEKYDPLTEFFYYEDGKTANTVWGAINEADNQPASMRTMQMHWTQTISGSQMEQ